MAGFSNLNFSAKINDVRTENIISETNAKECTQKSSMQIICNYRQSSYSQNVSDASGKTKESIKQLLSKKQNHIQIEVYLIQISS